jgi:hypothetical protein
MNQYLGRRDRVLSISVAVIVGLGGCSIFPASSASVSAFPSAVATAPHEQVAGWRPIAPAPIATRTDHTAVWTGNEMLVWGGESWPSETADDGAGAAYDPVANSWRILPAAPISRRSGHVATFTGDEMLIWGGSRTESGQTIRLSDGAAYNADTNAWRRLSSSPLHGSSGFVGAWSGEEWIVVEANRPEAPGQTSGAAAAYDPARDSWRRIANAPLRPGWAATATWTGNSLVVIRFSDDGSSGAQLDLKADTWKVIPINSSLGSQAYPFATLTPRGILVTRDTIQDAGGIRAEPAASLYDPNTMEWRTVAAPPPQLPFGPPVYADGLVVYYGPGGNSSWVYSTDDNRWFPVGSSDDRIREFWTSVWTGREMLIWGGSSPAGDFTSNGLQLQLND